MVRYRPIWGMVFAAFVAVASLPNASVAQDENDLPIPPPRSMPMDTATADDKGSEHQITQLQLGYLGYQSCMQLQLLGRTTDGKEASFAALLGSKPEQADMVAEKIIEACSKRKQVIIDEMRALIKAERAGKFVAIDPVETMLMQQFTQELGKMDSELRANLRKMQQRDNL